MLFGLFNRILKDDIDVIDGGTKDDTNHLASKTISSTEITSFSTSFYRFSDNYYDDSRHYDFGMEIKDGRYVIYEGFFDSRTECETDADFAVKLDEIIRKYNLIRYNGVSRVTSGLPPEYGPWSLNADYASGENLNFYENGNPTADWTRAVLDLFASEFSRHGIDDYMPVKESAKMTRFDLIFSYSDTTYTYGEIWVPVTEEAKNRTLEELATSGYDDENYARKAYTDRWSKTAKTPENDRRYADVSEDYYEALKAISEEVDLKLFNNGEVMPGGFDYDGTPQYYEFYVEYENGNRIMGFSDDPEKCEQFRPIANKYAAFFEEYLNENGSSID